MSKNDDLDMQTFQIYQDEETIPVPTTSSEKKQKRNSIKSVTKGNSTDTIKGIAIGLGLLILFIVIDQFI